MARPFAFPCHRILPARHSNATPVHSLRVRILNLGCPVLDAFQGRGFWCGWPRANCEMQFSMKDRKSRAPPVTQRDRWGTRSSQSKAGPPVLSNFRARGTPLKWVDTFRHSNPRRFFSGHASWFSGRVIKSNRSSKPMGRTRPTIKSVAQRKCSVVLIQRSQIASKK